MLSYYAIKLIADQQLAVKNKIRLIIGTDEENDCIVDSLSSLFSEAEKNGFRFTLVLWMCCGSCWVY
ncbi:hypothetical protein BMS81_10575 [Leuconostoc pseudomesenteroides]|nr:hypothetical protein BMS81_10575 [Leuconostoc pseudomesenteroides]